MATRFSDDTREWLEADGLGIFASGTVSGVRTRRYHGLLLTATTPPTGRVMLVNGFDAWMETEAGRFALSSQRYTPDVIHPDGAARIESFASSTVDSPWPTWIYRLEDGTRVRQEIVVPHGRSAVVVTWRVVDSSPSTAKVIVRPFLSGRDYHATHHENGSIFAIGGLPHMCLDGSRARQVVDAVERELLTPLGLRSLARGDPAYVGHYGGGADQRDAAYHQGPVWPWLIGAFVDGWLRVRAGPSEMETTNVAEEARERFVAPLLAHLQAAGLGHVSEIADPEPPFTPGGCPFQAWSLGELLRTIALVDARHSHAERAEAGPLRR